MLVDIINTWTNTAINANQLLPIIPRFINSDLADSMRGFAGCDIIYINPGAFRRYTEIKNRDMVCIKMDVFALTIHEMVHTMLIRARQNSNVSTLSETKNELKVGNQNLEMVIF